jgi:hypothetical protein
MIIWLKDNERGALNVAFVIRRKLLNTSFLNVQWLS